MQSILTSSPGPYFPQTPRLYETNTSFRWDSLFLTHIKPPTLWSHQRGKKNTAETEGSRRGNRAQAHSRAGDAQREKLWARQEHTKSCSSVTCKRTQPEVSRYPKAAGCTLLCSGSSQPPPQEQQQPHFSAERDISLVAECRASPQH